MKLLPSARGLDLSEVPARNEPRVNATCGHIQEDILSRIVTLKALCDQGFITNDEYERRKSAIVDELTFSFSQRDNDDDGEGAYGDDIESDDEEVGAGTMLATMIPGVLARFGVPEHCLLHMAVARDNRSDVAI